MLFLTHDLLTVSKCWRHDCLMSINVCTVSILAASLIISNVSPATTADVFIHRHHRCYWSDETPLITVSDHAFLVAGIHLWNSLPHVVTSAPILAVFQNRLETYLFFRLFSHWLSLSLRFNGHFPGEPRLVGVYWSKGWWRWWWQLDCCSYKSCRAPVKSSPTTNQHPVFYRLDALHVAQPTVSNHWR